VNDRSNFGVIKLFKDACVTDFLFDRDTTRFDAGRQTCSNLAVREAGGARRTANVKASE
jgi:hypothetical protein